jgi:antitoxin protein of toxin-antitoxin system
VSGRSEGEDHPCRISLEQAKKLASEHEDLVDKGLDKANEMADEKTGGRFGDQIDTAQDKVEGFLGMNPQDDGNQ